MPVDAGHPVTLVVTYRGGERRRAAEFAILVDGQHLAEQLLEKGQPAEFFDVEYVIPDELVAGKDKVSVRFQADQGNEIGPVFGVRTIRADAQR